MKSLENSSMNRTLLLGIGLALAGWLSIQSALAVNVQGLYAAEVPLVDASEAGRQDAQLRGLQAVLIKVTGERDIDVLQVLALHDGGVGELVVGSQVRDTQPGSVGRLWLQFDQPRVDSLLRQSSIPVWAAERSTTALFIAVQAATGRRVLSASDDSVLTGRINAVAAARGLPIILPLMDLRDQRDLNADDVLAGVIARMEVVSRRYRGESFAYASLNERTDAWDSAWTLVSAAGKRSWEQRGRAEQLLEALVNSVADALASSAVPSAEQAASPSQRTSATAPATAAAPTAVLQRESAAGQPLGSPGSRGAGNVALASAAGLGITVAGVRSAAAYGTLMAYLRSIETIQRVAVLDVQGDVVALDIYPAGSEDAVRQLLNSGYTLTAIDGVSRYELR
jgi:uncharacterized protein